MEQVLVATVTAVEHNSNRVNFDFTDASGARHWCVGSLKITGARNPRPGDRVELTGRWITDAEGSRVYFRAHRVRAL